MANPKRSDAAYLEDCDWSFADRPEVMKSIESLVRGSQFRGGLIEADDLRQELYLWLAVRPEVQAKPIEHIELALYGRVRDMEKDHGRTLDFETPLLEGADSL